MPCKHGDYLGGIRGVEDLRQRCRIDDETGCWHWGLAIVQGSPTVHMVTPDTGQRVKMRGRRAALYLARGHDAPRGHRVYQAACCPSADCVNPAHARSGTAVQHGAALASSGVWRGLPSKIRASRACWDKRGRKLKPDQVRRIRSSSKSIAALAAELGCSAYAVWCVRAGLTHKPTAAGASVFSLPPALVRQPIQRKEAE